MTGWLIDWLINWYDSWFFPIHSWIISSSPHLSNQMITVLLDHTRIQLLNLWERNQLVCNTQQLLHFLWTNPDYSAVFADVGSTVLQKHSFILKGLAGLGQLSFFLFSSVCQRETLLINIFYPLLKLYWISIMIHITDMEMF